MERLCALNGEKVYCSEVYYLVRISRIRGLEMCFSCSTLRIGVPFDWRAIIVSVCTLENGMVTSKAYDWSYYNSVLVHNKTTLIPAVSDWKEIRSGRTLWCRLFLAFYILIQNSSDVLVAHQSAKNLKLFALRAPYSGFCRTAPDSIHSFMKSGATLLGWILSVSSLTLLGLELFYDSDK